MFNDFSMMEQGHLANARVHQHLQHFNATDPSFVHAELRLAELHAAAAHHRLIKEYTAGHPEAQLRVRTAVLLRRIADRLAPIEQAPPARHLRVVSTGR